MNGIPIPDGMMLVGDERGWWHLVPLNPPVTVTTRAAIVMSGVVVSTNLPLNP